MSIPVIATAVIIGATFGGTAGVWFTDRKRDKHAKKIYEGLVADGVNPDRVLAAVRASYPEKDHARFDRILHETKQEHARKQFDVNRNKIQAAAAATKLAGAQDQAEDTVS